MYLQRLSLIDFKNVGEAQIELSPQINCMVGDNGTGKTNLLDAVHYLSMCKSAFGLSDTQCVRHGSEAFLVDGRYGEPATDRTERIVCSFKKGGQKKLCRNGKEYEKLSDHIGLIPLVLVTPSDTALINESGEERRKYLNSFISQLDREYLSALVRYNRLLAERNKLLKRQQSPGFEELIEVFDAQLCPRRFGKSGRSSSRNSLPSWPGITRRCRATASGSASATARSSTSVRWTGSCARRPSGTGSTSSLPGAYTATTC